jgi:hypothetical protein
MSRTWIVSDAEGRNSCAVTLAQYLAAVESATAHGVKVRLYTLEAACPTR